MPEQINKIERLKKVASEILELLVDHPETLKIQIEALEETNVIIRVAAIRSDVGKLIGVQGRTARSIRVILSAIAHPVGAKVTLDIQIDEIGGTARPPV